MKPATEGPQEFPPVKVLEKPIDKPDIRIRDLPLPIEVPKEFSPVKELPTHERKPDIKIGDLPGVKPREPPASRNRW